MSTGNYLYEFEGDPLQYYPGLTYRFRLEVSSKRIRPAFARVLFDVGDFSDYNEWVNQRNAVLKWNNQLLAESAIDGSGGRVGGGFWFGHVPIMGTQLQDTVTVNSVEYDLSTVPSYSGDQSLELNVYKSGTLVKTITITDTRPFRLGLSGRDTTWQFEITGKVARIRRVDITTSMSEMTQILKAEAE